jgi:hypothetical protein
MLNVQTATRADLEVAALENDGLMDHLGGLAAVGDMSLEQLREAVTAWIEAGDEIHESCR